MLAEGEELSSNPLCLVFNELQTTRPTGIVDQRIGTLHVCDAQLVELAIAWIADAGHTAQLARVDRWQLACDPGIV
jgi:hypothetical protein